MDVDNERNLEIIQRVALQEIYQNADSDEVERKEIKRETDKRKWNILVRTDREAFPLTSEREKENIKVGIKMGTQL